MLTYKPKRYVKGAMTVIAVLIFTLVCIFAVGVLGIGNDLLNQTLIFVVVAGVIYILTRYMIYEYTYCLNEDELSVTRVAGRIPAKIIRIGINANASMTRVSGKKELKALGVKRIENVCVNLSPRERMYAYVTTVNGKKTAVLFETDSLFALAVNERINMKKLSEKTEEGDDQNGI